MSDVLEKITFAQLAGNRRWLEQLLIEGSRGPDRHVFLTSLARLYEERSAYREATGVWQESFATAPSLEAGYQLLRHGVGETSTTLRAIKELFSPKAYAAIQDLVGRGPTPSKTTARHLAICGISYCGSTMLGRFLDSLDGFHDVGESHWLIEQRQWVNGSRQIDFFAPEPSSSILHCTQCGVECEALSMPFRVELQLHRSHWYFRLAQRLNATVLVSSDKNFLKYAALDPLFRFDAVVLFKSPLAAWVSFRRRMPAGNSETLLPSLECFAESWSREYQRWLQITHSGKKVFLYFDSVLDDPRKALKTLLVALDMPTEVPSLNAAMKGSHSIGGNEGFLRTTQPSGRIHIQRQERITIPPDEHSFITHNQLMSEIFEELLLRFHKRFDPPPRAAACP